jgi:hypothetical protein
MSGDSQLKCPAVVVLDLTAWRHLEWMYASAQGLG